MQSPSFRGIFPYLVSPIEEDTGRVREQALRALVEHLIASGVHGLSPLGSTGEFAYLTLEQRAEIVRIVADAAAERVPVVPGVAAFATDDARRQAERYLALGVQGLVLMLQTFFPITRAGIERYFQTVAESVEAPICLYSNPGLTVDLPPAVAVGGGSDGNFTAGIGVPTLDGLGAVGGNAHAEGEWVHLPSMRERSRLLRAVVEKLLAQ